MAQYYQNRELQRQMRQVQDQLAVMARLLPRSSRPPHQQAPAWTNQGFRPRNPNQTARPRAPFQRPVLHRFGNPAKKKSPAPSTKLNPPPQKAEERPTSEAKSDKPPMKSSEANLQQAGPMTAEANLQQASSETSSPPRKKESIPVIPDPPQITKTISNCRPLPLRKTPVFSDRRVQLRSRTRSPTPTSGRSRSRSRRGSSRGSRSPSQKTSPQSEISSPKKKRDDTSSSSETDSDEEDRHPKRRRQRSRRTRSQPPKTDCSSRSRSRRASRSRSSSLPPSKLLTPQVVADLVGTGKLTQAQKRAAQRELPKKYQSLFERAPFQVQTMIGQVLRPSFIKAMRERERERLRRRKLSPSPGGRRSSSRGRRSSKPRRK